MSQKFFKKYFLVNISDSKVWKPLLFVLPYIDVQGAVQRMTSSMYRPLLFVGCNDDRNIQMPKWPSSRKIIYCYKLAKNGKRGAYVPARDILFAQQGNIGSLDCDMVQVLMDVNVFMVEFCGGRFILQVQILAWFCWWMFVMC